MKRTFLLFTMLFASIVLPGITLGQAHFMARLTGYQEIPVVSGTGAGSATFTLTDAGLQYFITVDGLTSFITTATIADAAPGLIGPSVRTILFSGNTATGIWKPSDSQPLTPTLIAELHNGNLYVNVSTLGNPSGEVRGQIEFGAGVHFSAPMDPNQENPPVSTNATGTGSAVFTELGLEYKLTVTQLSGAMTVASIDDGAIGVNGSVVQSILGSFSGNSATGFIPRASLTAVQVKDLLAGRMYFNCSTAANPGGEIRGQLLLADGIGFTGALNGSQEVPPTGAAGTGTGIFTLTPAGLQFDITVTGLTGPITAAHFHDGASGSNGPVVRTITSDFNGTTASGLWRFDDSEPLTTALISELLAGNIYVNVHTAANPGGEIRAQVNLNPGSVATTFAARLTGIQEEPPVASNGLGTGFFTLTSTGLAYQITVDGLTSPITVAHFHLGPIGVSGGVLQAITFTGNTASGTWTIDPTDVINLLLGTIYCNVHTNNNPGGEIRGQLMPASGAGFDTRMTGPQEVPPNNTAGTATGTFRLTQAGFVFNFTADDLTGPIIAAHFHSGQRGNPGAPIRVITSNEINGTTGAGVWTASDPSPLNPTQMASLLSEGIYVNLHTAQTPGGEVRGQVTLAGGQGESAYLIGGAEVPPISTNGEGVLAAVLTDQGLVFRTTVSNLTSALTGEHFHNAAPGSNGPIVRDLGPDFNGQTGNGAWMATDSQPLTTALFEQIYLGDIYENAHTVNNPGGEIRGWAMELTPAEVPMSSVGPSTFRLFNRPDPVQRQTTVIFYLPSAGPATLRFFDLTGREIGRPVEIKGTAGLNQTVFDAGGLSSGVYLYRLDAGGRSATHKMTVFK